MMMVMMVRKKIRKTGPVSRLSRHIIFGVSYLQESFLVVYAILKLTETEANIISRFFYFSKFRFHFAFFSFLNLFIYTRRKRIRRAENIVFSDQCQLYCFPLIFIFIFNRAVRLVNGKFIIVDV